MKIISISIRFGLVTSAVLVAYFLILALFDKHTNIGFSFFNVVITLLGIYEAIRLKKLEDYKSFSYGEGFKTGLITGSFATLLFTVFFLFYSTEIAPDFLSRLLDKLGGVFRIDIGLITFIVAIMGLTTTVVSTFTVMQLLKKSRNDIQNQ